MPSKNFKNLTKKLQACLQDLSISCTTYNKKNDRIHAEWIKKL